jgi:uncharacterized membrane protein required for colicin V production
MAFFIVIAVNTSNLTSANMFILAAVTQENLHFTDEIICFILGWIKAVFPLTVAALGKIILFQDNI